MTSSLKFKGFDYVSYYAGDFEGDDSLASLDQTGANAVETTLDWGIDPQDDTIYADSVLTDSLSAEAGVIREAVDDGLSVMLKPHIDFLNDDDLAGTPYAFDNWRAYFNPGAPGSAGADAFFASYKTMLLQEAAIGAGAGASSLCIGTELDQITGPAYKSYWDGIISAIRAKYPSLKLTYASIWSDDLSPWIPAISGVANGLSAGTGNLATQVSFASELDYFGIDCYAPLSDSETPTLQQLVDGWTEAPVDSGATAVTYAVTGGASLISYFESVAAAVGKPLLFTEIGYENATDAAIDPPGTATDAEDDDLQARLYQALFQAWSQSGNSSLIGAYLYDWDPNASEVGPGNITFSPQGLPALGVATSYFAAPIVVAPSSLGSGLRIISAVAGVALSSTEPAGTFTATVAASGGLLFANTGGGNVTGVGTGKLTVTGTLAVVNADLATLQYEGTAAANDSLTISTSVGGISGASATILADYDPNYPVLAISTSGNLTLPRALTFSGTISAAAGQTVTIELDGAAASGSATSNNGTWSIQVALPQSGFAVATAKATDAAGNTGVSLPLMVAVVGGVTANFSATNGNVVDLFASDGQWDTVNGSNGYVVLAGSQATVVGGDDNINTDGASVDALKLTDTNGRRDFVFASATTVQLQNASASISGGGDSIAIGSGDVASLLSTKGDWDAVSGSGATIDLTSAETNVGGGGEVVDFVGGSGNAVSLYATVENWDAVTGSNGLVYETSAQASVFGGGDTIVFAGGSGNAASLYSTAENWDAVAGSNGLVYETSAQASVFGGGDTVDFAGGSGNAASLYSTAKNWDVVAGSKGLIYETSAQASVFGGGDTIVFSGGSGNAASLYATSGVWDLITGSNGLVYETSAQASVIGGGETIVFSSGTGNAASLYATGSAADSVDGADGAIYLTNASAKLSGNGNTVVFAGADSLEASGDAETLTFGAALGMTTIVGFDPTDKIQFAASDFARWSALQLHIAQSGADTTIRLDAKDVLTLVGVTASKLTSGEFRFV